MSLSVAVARLPRKDKKKEVKCPLSREMYAHLSQRADAHGLPMMTYLSRLAMTAIGTETTIRALSPYFRRGYIPRFAVNVAMLGRVVSPSLDALLPEQSVSYKRQSVKFSPDEHLAICEIAFSLSCPVSRALCILLNECILQGVDL